MTHQILIIEDNQILNHSYARFATQSARDLFRQQVISDDVVVHQAYTFEEAIRILQTESIDFISLDIALGPSEERLSDMQRFVAEPGGMKVLKWMRKQKLYALTAVVSGETLFSYALDTNASRDLGVMGFLRKPISRGKFQGLIQAVLLYLQVQRYLERPIEEIQMHDLGIAQRVWDDAVVAIQRVGWASSQFPQALDEQIEGLRKRKFVSLETGLPSAAWTEDRLKGVVMGDTIRLGVAVGRDEWMLGYVWVEGYRDFVQHHKAAEPYILQEIASRLQLLQTEFHSAQLFIGHIGFVSDPTFVFFVESEEFRTNLEYGRELVGSLQSSLSKIDVTLFRSQLESTAEEENAKIEPKVILLSHQNEHLTDINMLYDLIGAV